MPREVPRARRVAEQVQRTLAEMLRRDVNDPRLKPVTITHVRMSPDLSHAWVQFQLLTGDAHDPVQQEILDEAATDLRGPLGRALRLRIAPHIHFQPDVELERGQRLDALIARAVREDESRHSADASEPGKEPGKEPGEEPR
jgi:ribosome-binding factor A